MAIHETRTDAIAIGKMPEVLRRYKDEGWPSIENISGSITVVGWDQAEVWVRGTLAAEAESEHLELSILNPCDFVSGQAVELRVAARKSLSQNPVEGAAIEVKMISTVEPPRVLFRGQTSGDGTIPTRFNIPLFTEGTAAVIISAHSPLGNDEVKQLVKRKK